MLTMKLIVCCALLAVVKLSYGQVSVNYQVEFNQMNGQCGGNDLPSIIVSVPVYTSIQRVMETVVAQNSTYKFQLQYSATYAGYVITQVGGVSNQDPCRWNVYVSAPGMPETRVNSAVDNFHVANNYTIILRYEMGVTMITTQYSIEYPDFMCSNSSDIAPVSISTPERPMAIDVMEAAAQRLGGQYAFSVSYESSSTRYVIQELNSNGRTTTCTWMAYSAPSGEAETLLMGSIADFMIPADNSQLILRFREEMLPTTPSPFVGITTTRGAAQSQHGVSIAVIVAQVAMFLAFHLSF